LFYATVANEGMRPSPHAIEAIEQNGKIVYRHSSALERTGSADRASFYQLKTMLQGVVQRGTARRIGSLAPYVAGKTGTTDDENDAWFVGFTNDVTVAVWVGYDNADGRRRTLGSGKTGANVAVPIFEPIMQAVWAHHAPRTLLAPPSSEAMRLLVPESTERRSRGRSRNGALVEYLRRDKKGRPVDAQYALVSRKEGKATEFTARASATRGSATQTSATPIRRQPPAVLNAPPAQAAGGWGGWGWNERNANRWDSRPRSSPYESRQPFFFR
jgi:membrane carboxypeptidase/penicillin-binding protein